MEITAKLSNLRTAPRKTRLVADLIRGKAVPQAQTILSFTVNKSARPVLKLLNSAVASAKSTYKLNEADLIVSKITVDEGPKLKRWHPMSRGRAYPIMKRTSHINLVLSDGVVAKKQDPEVKTKTKEVEKPKTEKKPKAKTTTRTKTAKKAK